MDGKVLVIGGGLQGWLLQKLLEASPMADKTNASCSKVDLPQAKAEPISNSASGITDLRSCKKTLRSCSRREEEEYARNSRADTRSGRQEGEEDLQTLKQRSPFNLSPEETELTCDELTTAPTANTVFWQPKV